MNNLNSPLGEKARQVFASQYKFYLPSIEDLEKELQRVVEEIKYRLSENHE